MTAQILHVNKAFFPEIGGVETVCLQCANLSKETFDTVDVITIGNTRGFRTRKVELDGINVWAFDYQWVIGGHRFSINFLYALIKQCGLRKVIHAHDPFPLASLAFFIRRPIAMIVTYHSDIVKQRWLSHFSIQYGDTYCETRK